MVNLKELFIVKVDADFIIPDNYINATQLAKQYGKEVSRWLESKNVQEMLYNLKQELNENIVIMRHICCNSLRSTFIHPKALILFEKWLGTSHNSYRYEITRYEKDFEKLLEVTFKDIALFYTQYQVSSYRLDFYFEKYNLVVEYDEDHHNHQVNKNADIERELYITDLLGCTFIRVKQGEEFQGINQIIKFMMENKINE